jgi:Asp-tRNA(Asn)/Glu-tRNA(Gln) amidotransferase A subunit family amidase
VAALGATVDTGELHLGSDEDAEAFRRINEADRHGMHGAALIADERTRSLLTPQVVRRFEDAAAISGGEYAVALRARFRAIREMEDLFRGVDVVLSPTAGFTAPHPPDDWDSRPAGITAYTYLANYCGLPAASVPCGFVDGLPVGVQVMAAPDREPLILRVATALQSVFDWTQVHPSAATATA